MQLTIKETFLSYDIMWEIVIFQRNSIKYYSGNFGLKL